MTRRLMFLEKLFGLRLVTGMVASGGSKTLYIYRVNENGKLLYHTASPVLAGGVTNGQFAVVPQTYNGSFIHVCACTQWMLSFDTAFLYRKNIRIVQKGDESLPTAIITSLNFFSEDGGRVSGLRNK